MANFYGNLENFLAWPTENDHYGAGIVGDGRIITELNMTPLLAGLAGRNVVLSGFALPTNTSGTPNPITAGTAIVSGVYISGAGTYPITVSYTASSTNWVWLVLVRDSNGRVLRPEITVTAGATKPADPTDSVLLGSVTVNGSGVITATSDFRNSGRVIRGSFAIYDGSTVTPIDYVTGGWTIASVYHEFTVTFPAFLRAPMVRVMQYDTTSTPIWACYAERATSTTTWVRAFGDTNAGDTVNFEIAG